MLTQAKADELLAKVKEAATNEVFTWMADTLQEELFIAIADRGLQFILSLKRNPFEIQAQLRTKDRHLPLARIDNAIQHINPDGEVVRGPHLHWYREGHGVAWAELVDWYRLDRPTETLSRFLDLVAARFPHGFQEALL
jgi:hypothetical protein